MVPDIDVLSAFCFGCAVGDLDRALIFNVDGDWMSFGYGLGLCRWEGVGAESMLKGIG